MHCPFKQIVSEYSVYVIVGTGSGSKLTLTSPQLNPLQVTLTVTLKKESCDTLNILTKSKNSKG